MIAFSPFSIVSKTFLIILVSLSTYISLVFIQLQNSQFISRQALTKALYICASLRFLILQRLALLTRVGYRLSYLLRLVLPSPLLSFSYLVLTFSFQSFAIGQILLARVVSLPRTLQILKQCCLYSQYTVMSMRSKTLSYFLR